jgi:hypothetical protein
LNITTCDVTRGAAVEISENSRMSSSEARQGVAG